MMTYLNCYNIVMRLTLNLIETLMNLWSSRGVVDTETVGE